MISLFLLFIIKHDIVMIIVHYSTYDIIIIIVYYSTYDSYYFCLLINV